MWRQSRKVKHPPRQKCCSTERRPRFLWSAPFLCVCVCVSHTQHTNNPNQTGKTSRGTPVPPTTASKVMSSSTTASDKQQHSFLQTPLDVVQDCFLPPATATTTTSRSTASPHARVADAYRTFLQAHPEALASIPLIQPSTWPQDSSPGGRLNNHCLVRFRGMVTDMLDPQFFIGAHKDPGTGKVLCTMYRDALTAEEEEAMPVGGEWQPHQTMERRPLILGPITGEAAWVTKTTSSSISGSNKRPLSEREDAMLTSASTSTTMMMNEEGEAAAEGRTKMARTEERASNDNEGMMAVEDSSSITTNNTTAASSSSSSSMPPPLPRAKKAADASPSPHPFRCLTYFYDNEEDGSHPPKLNEALDVLAVLSYTTAAEKEKMMEGGGEDAEGGAVGMDEDDPDAAMDRLMLSLEPRLHILLWERASLLLPPTTTSDTTATAAAASDMSSSPSSAFAGAASPLPRPLPLLLPANHHITQARTELLTHFTHALAGDALAAEFLLLSLLSRVRLRTTAAAISGTAGGEVVVGPLPLNLSRVSIPGFAQGLQALLGSVMARVATVEVSLPSLSDAAKWIPRKDYESNMLLSSTPLQAAPGTVLILDETGLETGRLDGVGVTNVRCVKKLIEEQKTMCGFGFYELEFEADCPVVVVSKSRSIFSGGALCEVLLLPSTAASEGAAAAAAAAAVGVPPASLEGVVSPEVLSSLRRYLAALSGFPVEIDKALASQAEEEYVSLRGGGTEEGKLLTPEDLGRWLEMTRLLCASEGGGKACAVRHWGRMKEMEGERRKRVKAAQGGNVAQ